MDAKTVVLPPIKIGRKFVEDLDYFVGEGYFRNRSEAVRDAVKLLVIEMRRSKAVIREAALAAREARREMWRECLHEAKGSKEKARRLFIKKYG